MWRFWANSKVEPESNEENKFESFLIFLKEIAKNKMNQKIPFSLLLVLLLQQVTQQSINICDYIEPNISYNDSVYVTNATVGYRVTQVFLNLISYIKSSCQMNFAFYIADQWIADSYILFELILDSFPSDTFFTPMLAMSKNTVPNLVFISPSNTTGSYVTVYYDSAGKLKENS